MNSLCIATFHRLAIATALLLGPMLAHAGNPPEPPQQETQDAAGGAAQLAGKPELTAIAAAVADGVSTGLALSAGAVELNPAVSPTPLGLVTLTGAKIALVKYAQTLPEEEKRLVTKLISSLWSGAALNNIAVLLAAPPPVSLLLGLIMGLVTWHQASQAYEEADQALAARALPIALPLEQEALALRD
ncbi:hypothetical protein [Massilia cavernae]|uniref:Uncharacterized protein n=1 Tax=Massilia cavernae TaxID=2320864 RepID=A0A418Y6P3_9BURK|nr:hypothetical protein [Massilia cavernae]RJG23686.1 hypothetical protein D3872_04350 [Massilia cavernae]